MRSNIQKHVTRYNVFNLLLKPSCLLYIEKSIRAGKEKNPEAECYFFVLIPLAEL
jgi:hypothetical protein